MRTSGFSRTRGGISSPRRATLSGSREPRSRSSMPTRRISSARSRSGVARGAARSRSRGRRGRRSSRRGRRAAARPRSRSRPARKLSGSSLARPKSSEHEPRPLRLDEQVARVRIRVEEAVHEDLLGEHVDEGAGHPGRDRRPRPAARRRSVILMPSRYSITSTRRRVCSQTMRRDHERRCAARAGAAIASAFRPSFSKSSSRGICGASSSTIGEQVEVALEPADGAEQRAQVGEVAAHLLGDLGVLHLHRHAAPVVQPRLVHLRERRRARPGAARTPRTPRRGARRARTPRCAAPPRRSAAARDPGAARAPSTYSRRHHVGARAQELAALQDQAAELEGEAVDLPRRCRGGTPTSARSMSGGAQAAAR